MLSMERGGGQRESPTAMPGPGLEHVEISPLSPERFRGVLSDEDYADLLDLISRARAMLAGRVVWCVNSTSRGGGVAEMLRSLLAYTRGAGIDSRWAVVSGEPEFFRITKRLHNRLHGVPGDGGPLGPAERAVYEQTLKDDIAELITLVEPGDVVLLHDPQTAGLIEPMAGRGARVVWRAHIGIDEPNEIAREAWDFLRPYVEQAHAYVFSRERFVWSGLDDDRVVIIPPSIDVFSAKNQELSPATIGGILHAAGLQDGGPAAEAHDRTFWREDGTPGRVGRAAEMLQEQPLRPSDQVVVQVSRWDRLKDPLGVLEGFVAHAGECCDAHLVLAGPSAAAVADDPEGAEVLAEVHRYWHSLPQVARARLHLASLPMEDTEENAAIVNALQRRADVVVQKSLAEGFGLTVAEAMWKSRAVVASGIGGIQDQVIDGASGVLLDDPSDLSAYGHAICRVLGDPALAGRMGVAGHARVRERFLETRHLGQWADLIGRLDAGMPPSGTAR
jgi:trehalose synthase